MKAIIIIIVSLLFIWIIWSVFTDNNLESPQYRVLEKKNGYEIRNYDSYIVAETTVVGGSSRSVGQAFGELGGYIFGANTIDQKIAMTSPVVIEQGNTTIAMTTPVITEQEGEMMTMSFMMPSKFTLENLPTPNSENVSFKEVSSATFAVLSFNGWPANRRRIAKIKKLNELLKNDNIEVNSEPQLLQYDRPTKFPLLRTNEIRFEVKI